MSQPEEKKIVTHLIPQTRLTDPPSATRRGLGRPRFGHGGPVDGN